MKAIFFTLLLLSHLILNAFTSGNELKEFLTNDAIFIKEFQDHKIYLERNYLEMNEEGIFLIDEFNKILLSELFLDSQGFYIHQESLVNSLCTVYPIVWCEHCQEWHTVTIRGVCGKCGNFPSK